MGEFGVDKWKELALSGRTRGIKGWMTWEGAGASMLRKAHVSKLPAALFDAFLTGALLGGGLRKLLMVRGKSGFASPAAVSFSAAFSAQRATSGVTFSMPDFLLKSLISLPRTQNRLPHAFTWGTRDARDGSDCPQIKQRKAGKDRLEKLRSAEGGK